MSLSKSAVIRARVITSKLHWHGRKVREVDASTVDVEGVRVLVIGELCRPAFRNQPSAAGVRLGRQAMTRFTEIHRVVMLPQTKSTHVVICMNRYYDYRNILPGWLRRSDNMTQHESDSNDELELVLSQRRTKIITPRPSVIHIKVISKAVRGSRSVHDSFYGGGR